MSTPLFLPRYDVHMSERTRTLRDWILDQLAFHDWKQSELADRVGVSAAQVSRWISGENRPERDNCLKLAAVFDVEPNYVLSLAGHRPEIETMLDLDDPLVQFSLANADKISVDEKRAIIEFLKTMLSR